MNEPDSERRLAALVVSIAREQWRDESSMTYKNRASIPSELREVFVICADMGGLCVLDARGEIRVFLHDDAQEIAATEQAIRMALGALERSHPELYELVRLRYPRVEVG